MDFLNHALAQVADLFKSMTPAARMTAGMLLTVIVISMAFLFRAQSQGSYTALAGGARFTSDEIGVIEQAFANAGLDGQKTEGNRILVPRGEKAAYLAAAAKEEALPLGFGGDFLKMLKNFSVMAGKDQRDRGFIVAKQNELQKVVRSMRGVQNASVIISVEKKRGSFRSETAATAAVYVVLAGSRAIDPEMVKAIRAMVGSGIGAKPNSVTITDSQGTTYAADLPGEMGDGQSDEYISRAREWDAIWRGKIATATRKIQGAVITASVDLYTELFSEQHSTEFEAKAVVFEEEKSKVNIEQTSAGPAGRPGLEAQGGLNEGGTVVARASGPKSKETTSDNSTRSHVPETRKTIRMQPFTPKRVAVALGIPRSHYVQIWHKRNPSPDGKLQEPPEAEIDEIENAEKLTYQDLILSLIGPLAESGETDVFKPAYVYTVDSIVPPEIPELTTSERATSWLGQHWKTLGMTGVALFGLVMLRSMIRSVSVPTPPEAGVEGPQLADLDMGDAPGPAEVAPKGTPKRAAKRMLNRRTGSGTSLKEELSEMVREDPDVAVNILKSWIGNAS